MPFINVQISEELMKKINKKRREIGETTKGVVVRQILMTYFSQKSRLKTENDDE